MKLQSAMADHVGLNSRMIESTFPDGKRCYVLSVETGVDTGVSGP